MADGSWDTYTPDAPRRRAWGWVFGAVGGALLIAAILIAGLAAVAGNSRAGAWPLVQNVATRLRTDDGALDLYRRNPALKDGYPSEADFLARVREHREGLKLADTAPAEGAEYRVRSSPFNVRVRHRAAGGTWLEVAVAFGGPFRPAPSGEGIFRLSLGRDPKDLRRRVANQDPRSEQDWARFAELGQALGRDGGLAPGVRTVPNDSAAFAALVRQRRAALAALQPEARAAHGSSIRIQDGPFGRSVTVEAALGGDGLLKAAWKDGTLVQVELR